MKTPQKGTPAFQSAELPEMALELLRSPEDLAMSGIPLKCLSFSFLTLSATLPPLDSTLVSPKLFPLPLCHTVLAVLSADSLRSKPSCTYDCSWLPIAQQSTAVPFFCLTPSFSVNWVTVSWGKPGFNCFQNVCFNVSSLGILQYGLNYSCCYVL